MEKGMKFRVWYENEKRFLTGKDLGTELKDGSFFGIHCDENECLHGYIQHGADMVTDDPYPIYEYRETELPIEWFVAVDKKCIDIYENDVVENYSRKYIVGYSKDRYGFYPFACDDGCGCCADESTSPEDCTVICNIHENPELMEE
jgi:hypothetical protein